MAIDPVAGPILAGIAGPTAHKIAAEAARAAGILEVEEQPEREILARIEQHLKGIRKVLENEPREIAWVEVLGDITQIRKLDKKGLRYQAIFTPVVLSNVVFNVVGLGPYVVASLPAGWSFTPFPNDTEIYLQAAGTNANVLFWATDDDIGVAI